MWPLPASPRQPANCGPKREGACGDAASPSAPGTGRASRGRGGGGADGCSPCISENLVRASKRHGVTPESHRLSGRKGSYFVRFSQPGRHSQAWSPSTPHARAKAPRPAGGARAPACPMGAGSGVQGEDKHRHVLQRAMLAQTCQAVLVTPSVPAGQRQGRQEGGQEAPCRP